MYILPQTALQALHHPYFFALPYPSHPSKLPKCSSELTARPVPLEEVDANVDQAHAPDAKGKLKRKPTSPIDDAKSRSISRRLDFTKHVPSS